MSQCVAVHVEKDGIGPSIGVLVSQCHGPVLVRDIGCQLCEWFWSGGRAAGLSSEERECESPAFH